MRNKLFIFELYLVRWQDYSTWIALDEFAIKGSIYLLQNMALYFNLTNVSTVHCILKVSTCNSDENDRTEIA